MASDRLMQLNETEQNQTHTYTFNWCLTKCQRNSVGEKIVFSTNGDKPSDITTEKNEKPYYNIINKK